METLKIFPFLLTWIIANSAIAGAAAKSGDRIYEFEFRNGQAINYEISGFIGIWELSETEKKVGDFVFKLDADESVIQVDSQSKKIKKSRYKINNFRIYKEKSNSIIEQIRDREVDIVKVDYGFKFSGSFGSKYLDLICKECFSRVSFQKYMPWTFKQLFKKNFYDNDHVDSSLKSEQLIRSYLGTSWGPTKVLREDFNLRFDRVLRSVAMSMKADRRDAENQGIPGTLPIVEKFEGDTSYAFFGSSSKNDFVGIMNCSIEKFSGKKAQANGTRTSITANAKFRVFSVGRTR